MRCIVAILCLALSACQQQMAEQQRYRPLEPSAFFADQRSSRSPVAGTVARGQLQADRPLFTGRQTLEPKDWAGLAGMVGSWGGAPAPVLNPSAPMSFYAESLPFALTQAVLERGQERFDIYCAVCHDRAGTGRGMIVRRGFTQPPSFHADDSRGYKLRGVSLPLRDAPVGYYFEVITRGFGAMPDYAAQVDVNDRWAIIAYIRALQLSQHAKVDGTLRVKTPSETP